MNKKIVAKQIEYQQLSLPLYLGEPVLNVKKKLRNPEARTAVDGIQANALTLQRLLDTGAIHSSEARLQISNFLNILGLN